MEVNKTTQTQSGISLSNNEKKGKSMKYLVLSEQDKSLLIHLHDFIYLDSAFIKEYILTEYTGYNSMMQRLRRLEDTGYIKSFAVPVEGVNRPAKVYTLTSFGVQNVEELQGIVKWRPRWSNHIMPWYQHQLMLNRLVKKFQKQVEEVGLVFKEWIPEARATWQYTKDKTDVIKPDGIVIIGSKGSDKNIGIFMELERSVAKRQNTIQKVLRYNDFLNRQKETLQNYDMHVGFEAPVSDWRVLFIGGDEKNTQKTIRDIKSITNANVNVPILVASKSDVEKQAFEKIYYNVFVDSTTKTSL